MSRLMALLLLYCSGYIVGKYIDIEMLIDKTNDTYYGTLRQSGAGWHESANDYLSFVEYYFCIISNTYRGFSSRIELFTTKGFNKTENHGTLP